MIGQILPKNNERCYSNFSPTFREVNTPYIITKKIYMPAWPAAISDLTKNNRAGTVLNHRVLPLSLNVGRHDLRVDNVDSIYKKYVQHFYLQINLLKH
jgi:hypothetical protein